MNEYTTTIPFNTSKETHIRIYPNPTKISIQGKIYDIDPNLGINQETGEGEKTDREWTAWGCVIETDEIPNAQDIAIKEWYTLWDEDGTMNGCNAIIIEYQGNEFMAWMYMGQYMDCRMPMDPIMEYSPNTADNRGADYAIPLEKIQQMECRDRFSPK